VAATASERALELAYRFLGRRDRTVAEVRRHLEAKGVDEASIDGAVGELEEQGYLDDARYAARFAQDRRALDGWGAERIERRLQAAGAPAEHIAAAVATRDPEAELAAAVALLRRRCTDPPRSDRDRERALASLLRKGYELELAYDAVRAFERGR
jgi:regulatory protein